MRHKRLLFIVFAAVALLSPHSTALAQENWDNYRPRTLKQLLEQLAKVASEREVSKARIDLLFTGSFPSRVTVTYTGEKRAIPAKRKEFIGYWAKSRGLRQELVDLFEDELLFKEDSTEYWLPVQKQVIPFFAEELKKGDTVELYLIITGARTEDGVTDWVFLVNEFKK